ncbi:MAG: hypothetical protein ACKO1F_06585 [Flammeovirgaceae bacterium]
MKTIKNNLRLISVLILMTVFTELAASNTLVGSFSTQSLAITHHQQASKMQAGETFLPAALAVAAGVVVVAAFVVGFVDGFNAGRGQNMTDNTLFDKNYDKTDFSKFDI